MTRLLLLRHAESEWNAQGRWQGVADPPLSLLGERQAHVAGRLLQPYGFSAMVSSDLRRAWSTAALLAPALGLETPAVDAGLREYDVGEWTGLTRDQIEARWPGAIDDWRNGRLPATPGGERRDTFIERITAAVEGVAASRPAETVLVISHGGVIGTLAHSLGAGPGRVTHLAGRWFDCEPGGLRLGDVVALFDGAQAHGSADEGTDLSPAAVFDTLRR